MMKNTPQPLYTKNNKHDKQEKTTTQNTKKGDTI